ncbi:tRNA-dihydrouridine synthase [Ostreococcus tauri]|uniref:tRNA-dihydrouridine(47) synthase [NAD(P)(+)] n=1 Tax=Ostreococcus tauri TaxID=70448 RepID=A0A1Y5IHW9_OSTTA|nr:tRNA-dihydrouridine synthase [Ostreococcus tauri]
MESGADFVDLNCGCPIHETWRRGLGAALLKKPEKLERLVNGIVSGIDGAPLTVKIRLGIESSSPATKIAERLENAGAAAIIVHGRTKEQRYTKSADYDVIRQIVSERAIPVIGNGDVLTWYDAQQRLDYSGCAGIMVGRGALIKPWIFKEFREKKEWEPTAEDRVGRRSATTTGVSEDTTNSCPGIKAFSVDIARFPKLASAGVPSMTPSCNLASVSPWMVRTNRISRCSNASCDASPRTRTRQFQTSYGKLPMSAMLWTAWKRLRKLLSISGWPKSRRGIRVRRTTRIADDFRQQGDGVYLVYIYFLL